MLLSSTSRLTLLVVCIHHGVFLLHTTCNLNPALHAPVQLHQAGASGKFAVACALRNSCAETLLYVCRRYCDQEPDWTDAMLLLDQWDGAGWNLIRDLAAGTLSATALVDNQFCRV